MERTLAKLITGSLLMAALLLAPSDAEAMGASWGYVCKTRLEVPTPGSTLYGDHGFISVTLYSRPACTGSYRGLGYIFSKGATSSAANPRFLYDQPTLLYLAQGLRQAAIQRQQVYVLTFPHKPYAISSVTFSGWTQ